MAHPLESLHPRSLKHLSESLQGLVRGRLWLKVIIGLVLGVAVGVTLGPSVGWVGPDAAQAIGSWLALPGHLFLGLVQMVVVLLVFASIIRGLAANEDIDSLRRLGLTAVLFFLATTALAIVIGIGLTMLVRPSRFIDPATIERRASEAPEPARGAGADDVAPDERAEDAPRADLPEDKPGRTGPGDPSPARPGGESSLPGSIVRLIPRNPLGALVNAEMLPVVIFAAILGIALVSLPAAKAKPLLDLFGSLQEVCMAVVKWAMRLAPLAVFGLTAQIASRMGLRSLLGLSAYVGTVLLGLLLLLVVYLGLVAILARRSPWTFAREVRELQLLAFSTSSSAAVMPLSIRTAEDRLGIRPSVSQFVIPLGATINMNGTALYQGVAAIFLAQVYGVDLGLNELILLVLTAVGASIGSPAAPGVGIVILAMVLGSVGIPTEGLALILGVDRIVDMSRTAVNVTGDLVAAAVLDRIVGGKATAAEQQTSDEAHEEQRARTGDDVIVDEPPGPGAPSDAEEEP